MGYQQTFMKGLKQGCLFYGLSTLAIAIQFFCYIFGSTTIEYMDFEGWIYFIASCISHASQFALLPYILSTIILACRWQKAATIVHIVGVVLLCILNYLNSQVYAIYHFHINGFVLNMVFGEGAGEIFNFSYVLYLKEICLFLVVAAIVIAVWYVSHRLWLWHKKAYAWLIAGTFVGCTLFAHLWNIYANFYQHPSVMKSATLLPYYFPTSADRFLMKHGFKQPKGIANINGKHSDDILYPIQPLKTVTPDSLPNIVVILLDSWSKRTLNAENMPNTYQFAQQNQWFANHMSGSNGTRSGVFSLFFGLSCYYWESFEPSRIYPVLLQRMQKLGYNIQTYPSATWADPPFGRVIFGGVPNIHTQTEGKTSLERDTRIADMFIADTEKYKKSKKPFFSFLFFDLPHSFELPADKNKKFQPAWAFADYTKLNNDIDPTPFYNLYRNTVYQDDILLGRVYDALEKQGLIDG